MGWEKWGDEESWSNDGGAYYCYLLGWEGFFSTFILGMGFHIYRCEIPSIYNSGDAYESYDSVLLLLIIWLYCQGGCGLCGGSSFHD